MPECANCGAFVSTDFVRVFGIDGEAHSCIECGKQDGHEPPVGGPRPGTPGGEV